MKKLLVLIVFSVLLLIPVSALEAYAGVLISVPDVVGLPQSAAEDAIEAAGFTVFRIFTANSNTVPAGNVISQTPIAGTMTIPGANVDLVVSLGPFLTPVPDVVGLPQSAAEDAIEAAGFTVFRIFTANSNTVPAGNVISQTPVAGTVTIPGANVDLVVSLGGSTDLDFGDAPDSYGTLLASDGARHANVGTIFLGSAPDLESDGIPTANADGDDNDNTDDEDGLVSLTVLEQGETFTFTISHSGAAFLGVWIDYNQNGQFENEISQPERLVAGAFFAGSGTTPFPRIVPCDAIVGDTYMRLRFTTDFPFEPTGFASDGEVEDYKITILPSPPSSTCPPPPATVGGEMLPLDTTMVLVAGTHSVAAWMIPVIVSGIGIAIVIARKF